MQTATPFLASFTLQEKNESESHKKCRSKYFEQFYKLGLPKRKSEGYEYENLQPLFEKECKTAGGADITDIHAKVLPECQHSYVVLVNGVYKKELSDTSSIEKECQLLSLEQAFRSFGTLLVNNAAKSIKETLNPFALLNGAMHADGLFVYLAPKVAVKAPLQIISLIDSTASDSWIMPRVSLFLGASSELKVVHTKTIARAEGCFYNSSFDISLEENADFVLQQVDFNLNDSSSWFFEHFEFTLKRSSRSRAIFVGNSQKMHRDLVVKLIGEGADAELNGLWLLDGNKEMHTNIHIEHVAPHCRSLQLFKGVLDNAAIASFQGKIKVQQKAQKSEAYQLNNNLILSDKAQTNSKPNLEIFADDVKATHGATVGQLDQESLFYLKSRGIEDFAAKRLLIRGFCEDVVAKLTLESLQRQINI